MIFSKTFGYALRGILYVAVKGENNGMIQLNEIAEKLGVPRHFLGKVMKRIVKEGILNSLKGPYGGFSVNEVTLQTSLIKLVEITGETDKFDSCVLRLRKCNSKNPCPVHHQVLSLKQQWHLLLAGTTVGELIKKDNPAFIRSITAN